MRRPKYSLSPNEVERLVKEDQDRRRKLRIIQVREQSKANAAVIRNDVRREKARLLNNFASEIKDELVAEKEEKSRKLEQRYENTLRTIGEGHREALIHGVGESQAEKLHRQMGEDSAAQERYKQALERQRMEDSTKEYEQTKHILARQAALEKEKQRAAEIANLPPPPPDISVELEKTKKRAIRMMDMKAFATTHYHIPDYHVVRAGPMEQLYDAKVQAEDSDLKLRQDLEEKKRSQHERIERARIRGNEALQKEMLKHEYEVMLKDLSILQKRDRRIRKKMLSDIPKQVFIPPEIYLTERKERQRQMEDKFHEIFMEHSKDETDKLRHIDIPEHLASHQAGDTSSPGSTATHDVSIPMTRVNPALRDLTNVPQSEQNVEVQKPETVLKLLMNRVKEQRHRSGVTQKVAVPAASVSERQKGLDQLVMLAGSKAGWERTQEDSPGLVLFDKDDTGKSRGSGVCSTDQESRPDTVLAKVSDSDRMIEDLRRRIELIESQKQELAQQFRAQSSSLGHFMADLDGDQKQSGEEEEDSCTLEEVDIGSLNDSQMVGTKEKGTHVEVLPAEGSSANVATEVMRSNWNILAGSHLRPEIETDHIHGVRPGYDLGVRQDGHLPRGFGVSEMVKFDGGDFGGTSCELPLLGGLQRLHQPLTSLDGLNRSTLGYGTMGSVLSEYTGQGHMRYLGHGQGDHWNVGQGMGIKSDNVDLFRKVRQYTENAGKRQAGMDAETIERVQEYQRTLLQTHEERKKNLAVIRADIEKRRHELYTSTSMRPTSDGEGGQVSRSAMENLKHPMEGYQTTLPVGQKIRAATTDGTSNGDSRRLWHPIQPFTTSRGSLIPNLFVPSEITNYETSGRTDINKLTGSSLHTAAGQEQEVDIEAGDKQTSRGVETHKIDRVRKSLSFDDAEDSFNGSHVSWKDVFNDADNTPCSQAQTENSRLASSEEERGSPILPQGRAEMMGKSSNSMSGSSFLSGSALLAQAQEKKLGFEHRQKELQDQLMDIQQQKNAIMQTYYAGQKALQQRQVTLMSKLATASALFSEDIEGKKRTDMRAKLADIRSQINADARGRAVSEGIEAGFGHAKEVKTNSALDDSSLYGVLPKPKEIMYEGRDVERASSRQSLKSGGTPANLSSANLSSDSYLAEISFHKIRSSDDPSVPSSAFQTLVPGSSSLFPISRNLSASQQIQTQTWASILSRQQQQPLSGLQQYTEDEVHWVGQNEDYRGHLSTADYQDQPGASFTQERTSINVDRRLIADTCVDKLDDHQLSYPSTPLGLNEHQPHELSTIIEVDTPSSVMTSAKRSVTSALTTSISSHTINSLSSLGSTSNIPSSMKSSDIRADVFMDLPTTFQEGRAASLGPPGAIYSLTSGHMYNDTNIDTMSRANVSLVSSTPGDQKQMKAKRSLDFSEQLFATRMPVLVELTPLKAAEIQDLEDDGSQERSFGAKSLPSPSYYKSVHFSSFNIPGYSDYLRTAEVESHEGISEESVISGYSDYLRTAEVEGREGNSEECVISDMAVNKSDITSSRSWDNSAGRTQQVMSVLEQAQDFDQGVVERLRQQSQAVFGDMTAGGHSDMTAGGHSDMTAGGHRDMTAGGHSDTTAGGHSDMTAGGHSDMTAGGHSDMTAGGHSDATTGCHSDEISGLSLGLSSLTADLEEVSIAETT